MITTADAIQVMTYVAACHHRTAPRLDDREATLATAAVWAELFNEFRLELPDLVAAVKKRGARFETAPEPAEIIKYAREIRQERALENDPTEEYQALCESKFISYEESLARLKARTGQRAIGCSVEQTP